APESYTLALHDALPISSARRISSVSALRKSFFTESPSAPRSGHPFTRHPIPDSIRVVLRAPRGAILAPLEEDTHAPGSRGGTLGRAGGTGAVGGARSLDPAGSLHVQRHGHALPRSRGQQRYGKLAGAAPALRGPRALGRPRGRAAGRPVRPDARPARCARNDRCVYRLLPHFRGRSAFRARSLWRWPLTSLRSAAQGPQTLKVH